MALPFTDRELKRSFRELDSVASPVGQPRGDSHRLLLFYAVECGLKAVWLRRQNRRLFEHTDIAKTGHDLRCLLKELRVSANLHPPQQYTLNSVSQNNQDIARRGDITILHQVWRYGGQLAEPTAEVCEQALVKILDWVKGELT